MRSGGFGHALIDGQIEAHAHALGDMKPAGGGETVTHRSLNASLAGVIR